jgi:transcription elongation GreA/GreB family factor
MAEPQSETIDKDTLLRELRDAVAAELARAIDSQRETARGATHAEAKPENDKDTRALEQSYLARGLAERVATLENSVAALAGLKLRAFDGDAPVALGALVTLEAVQGGAQSRYFVVPAAGGLKLASAGVAITTVTPDAPLGRALLGAYEGDEVSVQTPQGARAMEITRVQ